MHSTAKATVTMTDIGTPILPAGEGILDFCAVGAMVHRLDSGIMPMRKATELKVRRRLVPRTQRGAASRVPGGACGLARLGACVL